MKRPVISLRSYQQETLEHRHDDRWQLVLGGSGAMELTVGSDSGSVEQGRMAAIPPGYHHRFCGTGHNCQLVLELPADSFFLTSPDSLWSVLPDATRAYADWLIRYPQMIDQHPESTHMLLAEQLAVQLQPDRRWLYTLKQQLTARPDYPWTVSEMASCCALSASTLQRRLLAATGKTPVVFLTEIRLRRAHHLICHTPLTLPDIALRCGYSTQSSLTSAFRRFYGETPGNLRIKKG
ncbi:helix-turn-helix transcriptional regulator [Morganella morganii]|uniref:helix-turn-helix transcriptional regulator n=1 Tax=Morganella morganii TaxID=582 RepID=UPI000469E5D2|nr:AraC family transcriptional regulator [Morganella morganii]